MSDVPYLFALAVLIAACLGSIAIWAPRRMLAKSTALGTFALFLPLAFAGWSDLLGRPKPVEQEWLMSQTPEADVLAGTYREGVGIYLWLQMADLAEPRAYALPWSQQQAEQLQKAMREAERQGTGVRMRMPFEQSLDPRKPPQFYALPQPALPPKPPAPGEAPQRFTAPDQQA
jgi:hypothetical protein